MTSICTGDQTSDRAAWLVAPRGYRTPLLDELDREWARLRRRARTLDAVRAWFVDDPVLAAHMARIRDLDGLLATTWGGSDHGDALLEVLVFRAATDHLAGRIVLQRLIPGLINRARRCRTRVHDGDPTDLVIGAAWIAIREFDARHRGRFIAPALVSDAVWIAFRRSNRRMEAAEVLVPTDILAARPAPDVELDPLTALAGTLRTACRAGVPAADLDLIRAIVVAGSPSLAARRCEVSVRTIRNRRDVATARVASALGPEWADWSDPIVAA